MLVWKNLSINYKCVWQGHLDELVPHTCPGVSGHAQAGEIHLIVADRCELAEELLKALIDVAIIGITFNGHTRPADWTKRAGTVTEGDDLAGALTVKEHVVRSTQLRLWRTTTKPQRTVIVDKIVESCSLQEICEKQMRSGLVKTLHRKILQVAIELVSQPQILVLHSRGPSDSLSSCRSLYWTI